MAHDDRDRMFDKALARHLRSSVPTGAVPDAASLPACPDPEILAAYHEHSLSPSELTLWKAHVVACTHCQFVLAQLAATDKIPLEAAPAQDPLLAGVLEPATSKRSLALPSAEREHRPPSWRWILLIPAGAMAAVLVAWIAISTPKPGTVPEQAPVEVAENRQPPPASSQAPPVHTQPAPPPSASSKVSSVSPSDRETKEQPAGRAQLPSPPKPDHGPSLSAQKQAQQQLQQPSRVSIGGGQARTLDEKKSKALAVPPPEVQGSLQDKVAPSPAAPPPPPQDAFIAGNSIKTPPPAAAPAANNSASHTATSPKPHSNTANAAPAYAGAAATASESVEVSAAPESSGANRSGARAMLRAAAIQDTHVFWAPGGKHAWRLGSAGSIEHTNDHGEKWTPQVSGVTADLTSASAPSASVCWIVGSAGTILRTTDAGAHWEKLVSPVPNDFTDVRATDAMHALIRFVPDRQTGLATTYETSDGGATWVLARPRQ